MPVSVDEMQSDFCAPFYDGDFIGGRSLIVDLTRVALGSWCYVMAHGEGKDGVFNAVADFTPAALTRYRGRYFEVCVFADDR